MANPSCDFSSQPDLVLFFEPPLRDGPGEYGWLGRRRFAQDHEGFFVLCMESMQPRNADILWERWFHELTLREIGDDYDIGGERVRQIEAKAFRIIFRTIKAMWEGL